VFSSLTYEDLVKRGYFSAVIGRFALVTGEIGVVLRRGVEATNERESIPREKRLFY
jgi:hypothetical protein